MSCIKWFVLSKKNRKRNITNLLKKYDYYIKYPYEEFTVLKNGKYGFKKHGYDAFGEDIYDGGKLLFCLGLCNKTKEEMIEYIEKHIIDDNEEVES